MCSELKDNVVEACICRDRIMMIKKKVIVEDEVVNFLCVYAHRSG